MTNGEIKRLQQDIAEIKTALLGSKYQEKGWIDRVKDLEHEVYALQKLKWTIYGGAAAIGALFSALTSILMSTS